MALLKSITSSVGIDCTYWLISKIEKDKISESAFVVFYGYPSKKQRDMGYEYLEKRYLNIYPSDYKAVFDIDLLSQEGMNETKSVYEFAKEHVEDFEGATDI